MDNISDKDKLGMAALAASASAPAPQKFPLPKSRPVVVVKKKKVILPKKPTEEDIKLGRISIGDANDMAGYKSGGMIDRSAIRGKTRGKIC